MYKISRRRIKRLKFKRLDRTKVRQDQVEQEDSDIRLGNFLEAIFNNFSFVIDVLNCLIEVIVTLFDCLGSLAELLASIF